MHRNLSLHSICCFLILIIFLRQISTLPQNLCDLFCRILTIKNEDAVFLLHPTYLDTSIPVHFSSINATHSIVFLVQIVAKSLSHKITTPKYKDTLLLFSFCNHNKRSIYYKYRIDSKYLILFMQKR